ncbi:hypothetical protein OG455_08445 [Kitasatospora sp. NBC_01287]|uniref:hypothetical protein n=1 Tax=Kitasatospora sp. NBC_01287 TaxID=2903573 RepID=UPI002250338E|nr:hypothetical protein [Kitasatospora sp. NBC_01287]MCX4745551.1 hypothetical protein [Kitasatospora sp. NBC_01287]
MRRRTALLAVLAAAVIAGGSATLAAGSPHRPPDRRTALPDFGTVQRTAFGRPAAQQGEPVAFPTEQVQLKVGQRLLVATVRSDLPAGWLPGVPANPHVIRADPEQTVHGCSAAVAGCSADVNEVYTAVVPGSTTVSWTFEQFGCKSAAKSAPSPVPCVWGTKTVLVTVTH